MTSVELFNGCVGLGYCPRRTFELSHVLRSGYLYIYSSSLLIALNTSHSTKCTMSISTFHVLIDIQFLVRKNGKIFFPLEDSFLLG